MRSDPGLWGRLRSAPFIIVFTVVAIPGCGKGKSDNVAVAGGSSSGGVQVAGGFSSGGAPAAGGGPSSSTGGGEAPLAPTSDCIHPKVGEKCDGDLCRIEPGCFIMGTPPAEWDRPAVSSDQVQVTFTHPIWMGRTEVTRAQWKKTGLPVPKLVQLNGSRECNEEDCPQGSANFYEMIGYANRLSEMEALEPCYDIGGSACVNYVCPPVTINAKNPYECEGYRLPMEAEWEYAARAGATTAFPTGDITPQKDAGCYPDPVLEPLGWYCANSYEQVQRVALKQPNAWGLHDMHGNMAERLNDLYGSFGYLTGPYALDHGPLTDPTGAMNKPNDITSGATEMRRVNRGGPHNAPAASARASWRSSAFDFDSASNYGFRIARTILEGNGGASP